MKGSWFSIWQFLVRSCQGPLEHCENENGPQVRLINWHVLKSYYSILSKLVEKERRFADTYPNVPSNRGPVTIGSNPRRVRSSSAKMLSGYLRRRLLPWSPLWLAARFLPCPVGCVPWTGPGDFPTTALDASFFPHCTDVNLFIAVFFRSSRASPLRRQPGMPCAFVVRGRWSLGVPACLFQVSESVLRESHRKLYNERVSHSQRDEG